MELEAALSLRVCIVAVDWTGLLKTHLDLYIDSKTLLCNIFNRVRQQSLNASFASDRSIRSKIKDTIDSALAIDKQKIVSFGHRVFPTKPGVSDKPIIIREKGIDMDILWCIVDAFVEECNCLQGRGIPCPTTFDPFLHMRRHSSVYSTGGLNLLGLHRVDPVCTQCHPWETLPAADRSSKTTMDTRCRPRKIRCNKGCRVVPRRRLTHKAQVQNRKTRGLVSRSDTLEADNSNSTPDRTWRVASAAPQHMTGYLNHLVDYMPASDDHVINTPNMGPMAVHGRGSLNTASMTIGDVLYVPGLDVNLVSTGQLAELGYTISIGPYGCRVYKDDGGIHLVGKAHYVDGYLLELDFLIRVASTN